jgi:transcriptional regulator with XRE-family HTH domain
LATEKRTTGRSETRASTSFLDWLEDVVATRGISWRTLARETGLSPSALSALRTGRASRPSMETCYRLASHLKYDLGKLLRLAGYEVRDADATGRDDPELSVMFDGLLELTPVEREPVKEFVRYALARAAARRAPRRSAKRG